MRWRDLVSGKQREENSAKSKRRAKARKMGKGVFHGSHEAAVTAVMAAAMASC